VGKRIMEAGVAIVQHVVLCVDGECRELRILTRRRRNGKGGEIDFDLLSVVRAYSINHTPELVTFSMCLAPLDTFNLKTQKTN
jgi:hypothetical protein